MRREMEKLTAEEKERWARTVQQTWLEGPKKGVFEFARDAELYVQTVGWFLSEQIGETAANAKVIGRLALIIEAMLEGSRPDDMASALQGINIGGDKPLARADYLEPDVKSGD